MDLSLHVRNNPWPLLSFIVMDTFIHSSLLTFFASSNLLPSLFSFYHLSSSDVLEVMRIVEKKIPIIFSYYIVVSFLHYFLSFQYDFYSYSSLLLSQLDVTPPFECAAEEGTVDRYYWFTHHAIHRNNTCRSTDDGLRSLPESMGGPTTTTQRYTVVR